MYAVCKMHIVLSLHITTMGPHTFYVLIQLTVFESELTTFLDPQTIYKYSIHWMFNIYVQK
jgi:hypothetical protein